MYGFIHVCGWMKRILQCNYSLILLIGTGLCMESQTRLHYKKKKQKQISSRLWCKTTLVLLCHIYHHMSAIFLTNCGALINLNWIKRCTVSQMYSTAYQILERCPRKKNLLVESGLILPKCKRQWCTEKVNFIRGFVLPFPISIMCPHRRAFFICFSKPMYDMAKKVHTVRIMHELLV